MKNFKNFLNEGKIYSSSYCNLCDEENVLIIVYNSEDLGEVHINSHGSVYYGKKMILTLQDIKNDMDKNNYNVGFFCLECEEECGGWVTIEEKRYNKAEIALKKIISMSIPPETIKDEDIVWF